MTKTEKYAFALKVVNINIKWISKILLDIINEDDLDIDDVKATLKLWSTGKFNIK